MKKFHMLLLFLCVISLLCACGRNDDANLTEPATTTEASCEAIYDSLFLVKDITDNDIIKCEQSSTFGYAAERAVWVASKNAHEIEATFSCKSCGYHETWSGTTDTPCVRSFRCEDDCRDPKYGVLVVYNGPQSMKQSEAPEKEKEGFFLWEIIKQIVFATEDDCRYDEGAVIGVDSSGNTFQRPAAYSLREAAQQLFAYTEEETGRTTANVWLLCNECQTNKMVSFNPGEHTIEILSCECEDDRHSGGMAKFAVATAAPSKNTSSDTLTVCNALQEFNKKGKDTSEKKLSHYDDARAKKDEGILLLVEEGGDVVAVPAVSNAQMAKQNVAWFLSDENHPHTAKVAFWCRKCQDAPETMELSTDHMQVNYFTCECEPFMAHEHGELKICTLVTGTSDKYELSVGGHVLSLRDNGLFRFGWFSNENYCSFFVALRNDGERLVGSTFNRNAKAKENPLICGNAADSDCAYVFGTFCLNCQHDEIVSVDSETNNNASHHLSCRTCNKDYNFWVMHIERDTTAKNTIFSFATAEEVMEEFFLVE